jgi:hypothetical protein
MRPDLAHCTLHVIIVYLGIFNRRNMGDAYQQVLWKNFAAGIDMLTSAVQLCPDELWNEKGKFYYLAYHTTIFLDYYLSWPVRDFVPVLPYQIVDPAHQPLEAVDDVMPERHYSRQEVLEAISRIREKCHQLVMQSSSGQLMEPWIEPQEWDLHDLCPSLVRGYTVLEILFYNLRHVQHHVGQLNYILRIMIDKAPDWIAYPEQP